jgi:DNA-binding NarL/FixJ family response regulator
MIRLLCVEDDPLVRTYLVNLLTTETDLRVVGAVSDISRALIYLRHDEIDVVLLDYQLHGSDGTRLLQTMSPWQKWSNATEHHPAVLFCTGFADLGFEAKARLLGARGVVAKERLNVDLIPAIRTVAGGNFWFSDQCSVDGIACKG